MAGTAKWRGQVSTGLITEFALVNESQLISTGDFAVLATLAQYQLFAHVAPAWNIEPIPVTAYGSRAECPPGSSIFRLTDETPPEDGILAFHTEEADGSKDGPIFVAVCVKNGSAPLMGDYSILSTLGHELIEAAIDPSCNRWRDGIPTKHGSEWSEEACDPVEAQSYPIKIEIGANTYEGNATNFVLPSYFDLAAVGEQTDYMGVLGGPFQLAEGGYAVVRNGPGTEQQIFGEKTPPEWRMKLKQYKGSRTARRLV